MSAYRKFITDRTTTPDLVGLIAAVRTQLGDPTVGLVMVADEIIDGEERLPGQTWRGKKATAWTAAQVTTTQTILDTAAELTPQVAAQRAVDAWPIEYRALVLALIDETNRLRAALRGLGVSNLPDVTPQQAIGAIRTKAGTLS